MTLLALIALTFAAYAEDAHLDGIRTALNTLRQAPRESAGPRDSGPELTVAKHNLRDWIESRLTAMTSQLNERELEYRLNSDLHQAKLLCSDRTSDQQTCYLNAIRFRRSGAFLIAQTGVEIECGFDEPAYLYSWSEEGWRRVWQTEQNTYTERGYQPQTIQAVHVSPYNKANDYLVLTLGTQSWCSSAWHTVYYRVFRLGPDLESPPIIDKAESAFLGDEASIQGSVARDEALVEFTGHSIDSGVLTRKSVRHFRIDPDGAKRVDPLALSPRDFVDEWLTHEWKQAAVWSESAKRASMRDFHAKLHKEFVSGEFIYPTMHCPLRPDVWQVGVDFGEASPATTYFLVRWRPPFEFRMLEVAEHSWQECTEEDRRADDEPRALFPLQDGK